jgi:preprotein translocase subunit SecB
MSEQQQPEFSIQRIYVKDLSFEAPLTPDIFRKQWQPDMNMDIQTSSNLLEADVYEVVLSVTVTVKSEQHTAFLAEVKYAGIFTLKNFNEAQLGPLTGSVCPSILYPYAREVISDVVQRASFPQLIIAPVNFDAIYAQQLEAQKEKAVVQ